MLAISARPFSYGAPSLSSSCAYHNIHNRNLLKEIEMIAKMSFPKKISFSNGKLLCFKDLHKASREEQNTNYLELLRLFGEADEGEPQAFYDLARCYLEGKGVKADGDVGLNWLKKAAVSLHPEGMNDFGRIRMALAADFRPYGLCHIISAANKKCSDAEMNLGLFYETGNGVRQDLEKALKHYKNAEALGNIHAAMAISNLEKKMNTSRE